MPITEINVQYYCFPQSNVEGRYVIDYERGLGNHVIIEAPSAHYANMIAEDLGLFDESWRCRCCGDRWGWVNENDGYEGPIEASRSRFLGSHGDPVIFLHYFAPGWGFVPISR